MVTKWSARIFPNAISLRVWITFNIEWWRPRSAKPSLLPPRHKSTAICFWPRLLAGAGWQGSRGTSTRSQISTRWPGLIPYWNRLAAINGRGIFLPVDCGLVTQFHSFRQALPSEKPLPKRVVGRASAHQGPFGSCLQVSKKLLQQRGVLLAELAVFNEYEGSVGVRDRELKATIVKQE